MHLCSNTKLGELNAMPKNIRTKNQPAITEETGGLRRRRVLVTANSSASLNLNAR